MGSLQLWLAVLGGVVLAGFVAHGAWQTRRAAALEKPADPPPLDDDERTRPAALDEVREPVFDLPTGEPGTDAAAAAADSTAPAAPVVPAKPRMAAPRIDALIDAITPLSLEQPISGDFALAHFPATRRAGSKPVLIEGLHAERGEWETPVPGQLYRELQAAVQLANRHGALNEIEYSEFVQKIQAFADALSATPDFPDMLEVVGRARELDTFAGGHDAQLAMRLRAQRNPWPLAAVQQHAQRHGFIPGSTPGRLVLPSNEDGAPPMLSIQFDSQVALDDESKQARIAEFVLAFDVPQTPAQDDPYSAWCAAGRALALGLDALVSDDNGQPLHDDAFTTIGLELAQLYEQLAQRDLAAGSPVARRLFS
jgi:hypothetical protein